MDLKNEIGLLKKLLKGVDTSNLEKMITVNKRTSKSINIAIWLECAEAELEARNQKDA